MRLFPERDSALPLRISRIYRLRAFAPAHIVVLLSLVATFGIRAALLTEPLVQPLSHNNLAAYLKCGLKPVANRVANSEGPPAFWRFV